MNCPRVLRASANIHASLRKMRRQATDDCLARRTHAREEAETEMGAEKHRISISLESEYEYNR
jgi:hypothetical protein